MDIGVVHLAGAGSSYLTSTLPDDVRKVEVR
jgi:hypothetical protein